MRWQWEVSRLGIEFSHQEGAVEMSLIISTFATRRIEGGIGVVLTWWPIKAYRPCPNFIDKGGVYQRSGQGLDEIAFGRDSTFGVDK
jgi:hypothetical protein